MVLHHFRWKSFCKMKPKSFSNVILRKIVIKNLNKKFTFTDFSLKKQGQRDNIISIIQSTKIMISISLLTPSIQAANLQHLPVNGKSKSCFHPFTFQRNFNRRKTIKAKKKPFEVLPKAPKRFGQNTSTFFCKDQSVLNCC